jgi:hypothetical protein
MTFDIIPGNALGCRTNAHRHGWDGSICDDASEWACGIESDFRTKYCATGTPRCFHLHLFDEEGPSLVIPDSGVGWLLGQNPNVFDDQVLLVWAPQAEEPNGMVDGRPVGSLMAGAYRIKNVERIEQRNHIEWRIHPYEDGWTYMGSLETQAPRFIHLGGPYIKQVDRKSIGPLFESAVESGSEVSEDWTAEERDRLVHFASKIDDWLDQAEERIHALGLGAKTAQAAAPAPRPAATRPAAQPPAEIEPQLATRLIPLPSKPPSVEAPANYPLIEESRVKGFEALYGKESLRSLQVASLTRSLVLLRGASGVGKSRIALDLIDDPNRERTLVVPVSSEWVSHQDLLGTWNPNAGTFEPSLFTNFMRAAEIAWRSGDFATRVVVFENFDLCPAENWLAEILLRSQYPDQYTSERTIHLPGTAVRGWAAGAESRLLISPSVRFVGTLDEPARSRTLSPRFLDNVGIVDVNVTATSALKLINPGLVPKQAEALIALDNIVRPLHAGVTLTTAVAIRACLADLDALGLDAWQAVDYVLEQEILAKLELLDPGAVDEKAALEIEEWAGGPGKRFVRFADRLNAWSERISQVHIFKGS